MPTVHMVGAGLALSARLDNGHCIHMAVPNSGSLFNLVNKEIRVKYVAINVEVCLVLLQGEQHLHKVTQRSACFNEQLHVNLIYLKARVDARLQDTWRFSALNACYIQVYVAICAVNSQCVYPVNARWANAHSTLLISVCCSEL
jgi:hypothetical protein